MSAAELERALEALRGASDALRAALEHGAPERVAEALARRESALGTALRASGPASPRARELVAEVERGDRSALAAARARLEALRLELEGLRQARAGLSRMRRSASPARFVSERA